MQFENNDNWFHFDGRPYQFETEFTEDELKEMEEKSERGRDAGGVWCWGRSSGHVWSLPMAAETERLCYQGDSDVFCQCLDALLDVESCCMYNLRRVGELFCSLFNRNQAKLTDV